MHPLLLLLALGGFACAAGSFSHGAPSPAAMAPRPADAAPSPPPPAPPQGEDRREEGFRPDAARKAERAAPEEGAWARVRQFPVPDYAAPYEGPRTDFRETVYWQPSVRTGPSGEAQVQFYLSDAVTSFRTRAEGVSSDGAPGRAEALLASRLPVSLAARLPLEVSTGDTIELPVTVTNTTQRSLTASLSGEFGAAFRLAVAGPPEVALGPGAARSVFYSLRVTGNGRRAEDGSVHLAAESGQLRDALRRVVRVAPPGYPGALSRSGSLEGAGREQLDLPDSLADTLEASLALYPSATASLVAGTEGILQEPSGCFEQASSANYPNVMVVSYLARQNGASPEIEARARGLLDRGYKKLVAYESKDRGYEWFGASPANESLTAYGLLEFSDMLRVYPELDRAMLTRTAEWLKSRRDGHGGYRMSERALDSFGRASPEVTAAYVAYALGEAGEPLVAPELERLREAAARSKDPYVLALTAATLAGAEPGGDAGGRALARLYDMQAKDGGFPGADHSITRSGGQSLVVETTALAALAMMKAKERPEPRIQLALGFLTRQRGGSGTFGSTQATVLALKALTQVAAGAASGGAAVGVRVNGGERRELRIDPGSGERLVLGGLEADLRPGHNVIELDAAPGAPRVSYSLSVRYRTHAPPPGSRAPVSLSVTGPPSAKLGQGVRLQATLTNTAGHDLPMVLARIGLPGGLAPQTWQLDELRDRKIIDFYETREREVIVYLRGMSAGARRSFPLDLLAQVPGSFTAPASQTYLYYTDEQRSYAPPLAITITRPQDPTP